VYLPFLTAPAPVNAPFTRLLGGVDILEANRPSALGIILPEPLPYWPRNSDGGAENFFVDEYGQRPFALTASRLTVVELARVPLGFGSLAPSSGSGARRSRSAAFRAGSR
jgi:hypothetical protein